LPLLGLKSQGPVCPKHEGENDRTKVYVKVCEDVWEE
jgi:hypothetical protein